MCMYWWTSSCNEMLHPILCGWLVEYRYHDILKICEQYAVLIIGGRNSNKVKVRNWNLI